MSFAEDPPTVAHFIKIFVHPVTDPSKLTDPEDEEVQPDDSEPHLNESAKRKKGKGQKSRW